MKKFITAILTIAMLASLAGCTENSENNTSSPDKSNISGSSDGGSNSSTDSEENSEPAESTPEKDKGEPTFLVGLDGEPIYSKEITTVLNSDEQETTIDKITAENFYSAVCEGMCFLSEPSGISSTEYDDPDSWNGALNCIKVPTQPLTPEYKRLKVGDTFCGLTIKKASTEFVHDYPDYFNNCTVEFDGEITLTGYFRAYPGDDYNEGTGDLQFLIDDKSAVLPGFPDATDRINNPGAHTVFSYNGFYLDNGSDEPNWYWGVSEYGQIYLGNVDTCTADISAVGRSDDRYERYYKAKVKINNLRIGRYYDLSELGYRYYADIIELEPID